MHLNWEMVYNGGDERDDSSYHMIFVEKTFDVIQECVLFEDGIDIEYYTRDISKSWNTEQELITAIKAGLVVRH